MKVGTAGHPLSKTITLLHPVHLNCGCDCKKQPIDVVRVNCPVEGNQFEREQQGIVAIYLGTWLITSKGLRLRSLQNRTEHKSAFQRCVG